MNASPQNGVRVEVRGVRKRFGDLEVLKGIELTVEPGEIFVLMGGSGSGKTVLLRQIIGLDRPDSGEVLVDGRGVHGKSDGEPVRMAMVFQSAALLQSLSVAENVGLYLLEHRLYPREKIDHIVQEKLRQVGLEGAGQKMPSELSGGMRKRAAIARALVMEPQLILYDEPTSELDPLRSYTIGREILSLKERLGVTSIVVTHDRDLALGIAQRIAFLAEGKVRFVGTPAELQACEDPLIRKFLTIDFSASRRAAENHEDFA
jgi:phospholipid/cholesterol/gamma-HCH transport system ATP-binding protein